MLDMLNIVYSSWINLLLERKCILLILKDKVGMVTSDNIAIPSLPLKLLMMFTRPHITLYLSKSVLIVS